MENDIPLKDQIALLSEQIEVYKQQAKKARDEAWRYKCQLEQKANELQSLSRRKQDEIQFLQSENNGLQRQLNQGGYERGAIDGSMVQLRDENMRLKEDVAKLRSDVQYYQSQIQKLQQEKELSDRQRQECQRQLHNLVMRNNPVPSDNIDVSDLQRQLTNEKAKRVALEKEYENLLAIKREKDQIKREKDQIKREKDQIEQELHKTMEELEQLKKKSPHYAYEQENKLLGDRLRSLQTQMTDLEIDRNKLQRDKNEVTRQLRHAQTTNKTAYQQEVHLQEKVHQLEKQLKEFNQSNNLSMEFEELVEENEKLTTKLTDQFKDHQKEVERWDSDRAQLLIQISNLKGEVRDLKAASPATTPDPVSKKKNKSWWSEPQNTIIEEEPISNGEYSEEQPAPFKRSVSSNGGSTTSAKPMNVGSSGSASNRAKSEKMMRMQFNEMQSKLEAQVLEVHRLVAENKDLKKRLEDPPPDPLAGIADEVCKEIQQDTTQESLPNMELMKAIEKAVLKGGLADVIAEMVAKKLQT